MANRRIVLQPAILITSATVQDTKFAVPTMGAKTALLWVNVVANASTNACTIKLLGASSLSVGATGDASGSFWLNLADVSVPAAASGGLGAFQNVATVVPDFLRWEVSGTLAGAIQFEVVVYLYDT